MRTQRTLFGLATALAAGIAMGQSNGGSFDAVVVLTPGMTLQRGQALITGGFQSAILQHADVIRTDNWRAGDYHIVTSDGTVIGIRPATTVLIDGRQIGFDVFRVMNGSANILGNVNNGYSMPMAFRRYMPVRTGNVTIFPNPNPWDMGSWEFPISTFPRQDTWFGR